ncbi:MAG TPA: sterol desaturase family protein, partial [Roseovarius sp.]|nr:sterol desaturase family protein [Roseovarius sp.]
MSDQITFPDVVSWAVPFFIAAILIELLWIVTKGR